MRGIVRAALDNLLSGNNVLRCSNMFVVHVPQQNAHAARTRRRASIDNGNALALRQNKLLYYVWLPPLFGRLLPFCLRRAHAHARIILPRFQQAGASSILCIFAARSARMRTFCARA